MDTRTPRTGAGSTPRAFFDDEPVLTTVKVPSDPAEVVVNHTSFRVRLAGPLPVSSTLANTAPLPVAAPPKRRAPVVWSGRAEPGDAVASQLLRAVQQGVEGGDGASTQVLPRMDPQLDDPPAPGNPSPKPTIVSPRGPQPQENGPPDTQRQTRLVPVRPQLLPSQAGQADQADQADQGRGYGDSELPLARLRQDGWASSGDESGRLGQTVQLERFPDGEDQEFGEYGEQGAYERSGDESQRERRGSEVVRHAYYPGRRMNLGVVLLPLRIFLGFISIYAGMGKLTDPVYFDGGERGSLVSWLRSLEPWGVTAPLHQFAVSHPVGAGLTVAFMQIVVGVLTVFGLWQRVAAAAGALLSAALIMTVSWRSVPAYDAPDIIYLAAWSPLIIAGAPVYSLDGRLASEAWRRLGPRSSLWDLRRQVLRRGLTIATVLIGLSLLIGSVLGGAVRSAQIATVPQPMEPPVNQQPGSPLPQQPGERTTWATQGPGQVTPTQGQGGSTARSSSPSPSASSPEAVQESSTGTGSELVPEQEQTVQAPQPAAPTLPPRTPDISPTTGGSEVDPVSGGGGTGGDESGDGGGTSGGHQEEDGPSSGGRERPGALGGLFG